LHHTALVGKSGVHVMKSCYQEVLSNFDYLPDSSNVRLPIVQALYAVSAATIWRQVLAGKIPKPRKLTTRTTVWNVGELRAALNVKGEQE
jgi:predicted DNA-binding transcriptional regulator AlpA